MIWERKKRASRQERLDRIAEILISAVVMEPPQEVLDEKIIPWVAEEIEDALAEYPDLDSEIRMMFRKLSPRLAGTREHHISRIKRLLRECSRQTYLSPSGDADFGPSETWDRAREAITWALNLWDVEKDLGSIIYNIFRENFTGRPYVDTHFATAVLNRLGL